MTLYEQGDIIEVDFDPTLGHEPKKMRPALVVSVGYFNNVLSSLTVVCPITSTVNGHPLHVKIASDNAVHGCICLEQIRAIDQPQTSHQENRAINGYGNHDTGSRRHRRNVRHLIAYGPDSNARTGPLY